MSGDATGSVTRFFGQLRTGDSVAAAEIWNRFFPRLHALARQTLAGYPQRVEDAEDAVQSAFVSLWQRANRGEFAQIYDREHLWNVLGLITVRKALKQVTRERAQKRGGGHVRSEADLPVSFSDEIPNFEAFLDKVAAPDFDLTCEELLLRLNEEQRQIAILRLMGHTNAEIAELQGCTIRKIQRKLHLIRLKWEQMDAE